MTADALTERSTKQAILRGLRHRCPNCGEGHLFSKYLKVVDECSECGAELHHHRADDGPAYLTILVVGHLMAPLIHIMFVRLRPDPWIMAITLTTACVALALFLLPRMKGLVVAIQWAKRMHGFGHTG